jgi:prepilin-type N-terminal cleavage/methylation domain-containing protein
MTKQSTPKGEQPKKSRNRVGGFSLVELMIVVVISLVIAGMAVPKFLTLIHNARLQGAGSDLSGLLQRARIRAVQDDTYYSTYIITSGSILEAYVDLLRNGGTGVDTLDPVIQINKEVTLVAASSAPSTSNLKGQFLPVGSTLTPNDGNSSTTPVIFSPRGLPCATVTVTGGTICNSAGGATAFWIFFQDSNTQQYQAVTITPAGRIQNWGLQGTNWVKR